MNKLEFIQQLHEDGCAIACIAMITGMSYSQIQDILPPPEKFIFRLIQLQSVLINVFNIPCKFIEFTSLQLLRKHCVLGIYKLYDLSLTAHCVVFDANNTCILDPANEADCCIEDLDEHRVFGCIEIDSNIDLEKNRKLIKQRDELYV